jgi:membrane-bound inhibitor of C-type lysozyme
LAPFPKKTPRAGGRNKMNKSNPRSVSLALLVLILITGFGCSSDKAFKSGVTYACDEGKSFVVELYESVDIAFLTIDGKRFYLHCVPSESGTRYSDGNTTLWIKGQNAFVEIGGQSKFKNCLLKPK